MFGHDVSEFRLQRNRRLSVTALESRVVMSSTASLINGQLVITGDVGGVSNEAITVTNTGNATFRVDGVTNGSQPFPGVKYLAINTLGGAVNNVRLVGNGHTAYLSGVTITGSGGLTVVNSKFNINYGPTPWGTVVMPGQFVVSHTGNLAASVFIEADTQIRGSGFKIGTGAGNDVVAIEHGAYIELDSVINLGKGTNSTAITGAMLDGTLKVVGQMGNDTVEVTGTTIGTGFFPGGIDISVGDGGTNLPMGTDNVTLTNVTVRGNGAITSTQGSLKLTATNVQFRAVPRTPQKGYLDVSSGKLEAIVTNGTFDSRLQFTAKVSASHDDRIAIKDSRIGGEFKTQTGAGADIVGLNNTTVVGNASVSARAGLGFVAQSGAVFQGNLNVSTMNAPDTSTTYIRIQDSTVKRTLLINTGDGNDKIELLRARIGQASPSGVSLINTDGGNDEVDLTGTTFYGIVRGDGGTGDNTLRKGGAQFLKSNRWLDFRIVG